MITKLLPNERLDDLQIKGYEIIQSPGRFCFGMDAVLLSAFARVKKNEKALDLGTGTGILPRSVEKKLIYVGNSSKTGAAAALLSLLSRREMEEIAKNMTYLELGNTPGYERLFAECMLFELQ